MKDMFELESRTKLKIALKEDRELLKNLSALYLHDLSEFRDDIEVNDMGCFEFDSLDKYLEDERLHPILIFVDDKPLGFILLSKPPFVKPGCDFCIQEFFILRGYRRRGIAAAVLNMIFELYKGKYNLIILDKNIPALSFWRNLHKAAGRNYEEGRADGDYTGCFYQVFDVK